MAKCPYCYSEAGTFTDDPLMTPNHPNPAYRGVAIIRERHIVEIRTAVNAMETESGISPLTTWTSFSVYEANRGQHINEIRAALEGVISASGKTLQEFLSADIDGNQVSPPQAEWLDGNRLAPGTIIRGMHIEEIRKVIAGKAWDTISCYTSGNYSTGVNPALTNRSVEGESHWFHKTTAYNRGWMNNIMNGIFYQKETGLLYLLSFASDTYWSVPCISWNPTGNLDNENWSGYMPEAAQGSKDQPQLFQDNQLQFSPALPFEADSLFVPIEWYGFEGISHAAIDDSDPNDYVMYTVEYFYSRAGGGSHSSYGYYYALYSGAPNYVAKYTMPKRRVLGTGDGTPSQTFSASSVSLPIHDGSEILYVGGVAWTKVPSFAGQTSQSNVYTLDNDSGLVTFGNGIQGKVCPDGASVEIFITLKGGGWWAYQGIVGARAAQRFYHTVQAKEGLVWWTKADNAFEQANVFLDGDVVTSFTGTTVQDNIAGEFLLERRYNNNSSYTGWNATVTAQWHIAGNPRYSGTQYSFVGSELLYGISIYVPPSYNNDSPLAFSVTFNHDESLKRSASRYFTPTFISQEANAFSGVFEAPFIEAQEILHYGYVTGQGTPGDPYVFHEDKWREMSLTLTTDAFGSSDSYRSFVTLLDMPVDGTSNVLDQMTGTPEGGGYVRYEKTVGNVTWGALVSGSSYPGATIYRKETGNSDALWGAFPWQMKYKVYGFSDSYAPAFGGSATLTTTDYFVKVSGFR